MSEGVVAANHHRDEPSGRRLLSLSMLALGIVYGDIGTSPLDNRGEGGILALMGLVGLDKARRAGVRRALIVIGVFGAKAIQVDWFSIVGASLILHDFGQGALLIRQPAAAHNPFYLLAPKWALYPLVALATMATIIASQAIISGVFSLTRQAIQLVYCLAWKSFIPPAQRSARFTSPP